MITILVTHVDLTLTVSLLVARITNNSVTNEKLL
jgi:hypothetical protein